MDNKITLGELERKLDRAADLCEALDNAWEDAFDDNRSHEFKKLISHQINVARFAYASVFEACIKNVAGYFGGNLKTAESYVKIARQLRIEDPQGFKERVETFNN
jgi:hypothetical protein